MGLAIGALLAIAACGGSDDSSGPGVGPGSSLVGGSCSSNGDCQHSCATGGDYPGGMCTVSCASDADCPGGTACIDDKGGICAVLCQSDPDCGGFGAGWKCDLKDAHGAPGKVSVCRGD